MSKVQNLISFINSDKKIKMATRGILILLVLIPIVVYTQKPKADPLVSDSSKILGSNTISLDDVNQLVQEVSKIADLPPETPNVATVQDVNALKGQLFFAKAENGDKVLIFQQAARAILYRPSTNKIIEYSAIVVNQETPTPTQASSEGSASTSAFPTPTNKLIPITVTPVPSQAQ